MCHPNSNERNKSENVLNVNPEEVIGPQFEHQETNVLEIQTVLPDYHNRLETLERNDDNEESQGESVTNATGIGEITEIQSNFTDNQWQELNQAIVAVPSDRRNLYNFHQSRNHRSPGISLRHKRRLQRRKERKGMNHKLNKMNKLLRKTVRRVKHIKHLMSQQVELVKHLHVMQPNSEVLLRFTE